MDEDKKRCGGNMGVLIVGAALGVIGTLLVLHMSPRACKPGGARRCKPPGASQAAATPRTPKPAPPTKTAAPRTRNISLPPDPDKPYVSSCIIKAGPNEVLKTLAGNRPEGPPPDIELIKVRMLGYESVMAALADTDLMAEVDRASEEAPDRRGQLEDALHKRIAYNITIEPLGRRLIKVSYRDDTPDHAVDVLRRLVNHFVENALKEEQTVARKARERALKDLAQSKDALSSIESKLISFLQDHPGVRNGAPLEKLALAGQMLSEIDQQVASTHRRLTTYTELLEDMQKEPKRSDERKKVIGELTEKILEAEAKLDGLWEMRRETAERKLRLEEAVREFPSLHQQLAELERAARAAEEECEIALKRFRRVHKTFMHTVEGLVSFSVISPARRPHAKDSSSLLKQLFD